MADRAPSPVSSVTTLAIIDPSGKRRLLGHVFRHRNPLIEALVGAPLRWHLDFNTWRHNRRTQNIMRAAQEKQP